MLANNPDLSSSEVSFQQTNSQQQSEVVRNASGLSPPEARTAIADQARVTHPVEPEALLDAARAARDAGLSVVPAHIPLFGATGALTGCSCGCSGARCGETGGTCPKVQEKKGNHCEPRSHGKHPRGAGWQRISTEEAWQRAVDLVAEGKPVNLSARTGSISGVMLVDIDLPSGLETLRELEKRFGPLPTNTLRQRTGSGGEQRFFRIPQGRAVPRNSAGKLGKNVDIRGEGGQGIIPPSLHNRGALYSWVPGHGPGDVEMAVLPTAWLDGIEAACGKARPRALSAPLTPTSFEHARREAEAAALARGAIRDTAHAKERAWRYIDAVAGCTHGEGYDNLCLSMAACVLRGFAIPEDEAVSLLAKWGERMDPPAEVDLWPAKWMPNAILHGTEELGGRLTALPGTRPLSWRESIEKARAARGEPPLDPAESNGPVSSPCEASQVEKPTGAGTAGAKPGFMRFKAPLSAVDETDVTWVSPSWVNKGELHILAGDKGTAKSTVIIDAFAQWSSGRGWLGGQPQPPARCLILVPEDRVGIIRQKLRVAGGNLELVDCPEDAPFSLPESIPDLEKYVLAENIQFVAVDSTLFAMQGSDTHKQQDVVAALQPLSKMCQRLGVTGFAVIHRGKGKDGSAGDSIYGSIGFRTVARQVLIALKDREAGKGHFILARVEGNAGADPDPLRYHVWASSDLASDLRVSWDGAVRGKSADDLVRDERQAHSGNTVHAGAKRWLRNFLANGGKTGAQVFGAADKAGLTSRQVRDAAHSLGIPRGQGKAALSDTWRLPTSASATQPRTPTATLLPTGPTGGVVDGGCSATGG
jgi:hypothetical protein